MTHLVCISLDFDTVALWQAMGQTTPTPISRGEFGVVVAARLLDLFDERRIRTTWFVPGITGDTYPDICAEIARRGHEVGHHGYDHVPPGSLTKDQEREQLIKGNEVVERISGRPARGYRSPAWDLSPHSIELLLEQGFVYDSSMMAHDMLPYRARTGDVVQAGQPVQFGTPSDLWELPISWSADDFPHFEYFKGGGLMSAQGVMQNWLDDFRYMQLSCDWGVMTYTLHPFVIGRGHRMLMLSELLQQLAQLGAEFVTCETAIQRFADEAPQANAGGA